MKEKILKILNAYVEECDSCLTQSEERYEDGNVDDVALYHYWDGATDMAHAIRREIKNILNEKDS